MNAPHIEKRPFSVAIPDEAGSAIVEQIEILVEMEWDEELQEWLITDAGERKIDDTKARHMGLLLPTELKALRERLGLTQAEIGGLLQIGGKTWTRWENGRQRPSRSINLLLRALADRELTVEYLRHAHRVGKDWRTVVPFSKSNQATEAILMDRLFGPQVHTAQCAKMRTETEQAS